MVNCRHPVGLRMGIGKMIVMDMGLFAEDAASNHRLGINSIGAGHIQRNRIEGCKHTHIGHNGHIIFSMAVAIGGNVHNKADMEMGTVLQNSQRVLSDLAVEDVIRLVMGRLDRIHGADADTAATAYTLIVVNGCFLVSNCNGSVGTDLGAGTAADALFLIDVGLAGGVHFHLTGTGTTAHTNILQCAAESGTFMAFEMVHGDENIGIHDSAADLGFLDIVTINGDNRFIGTLQTVSNDHMAAGSKGIISIFISSFQMVQSIFTAAHIKRIAVRQEDTSTLPLDQIDDHLCIVGAQIGQVTRPAL